MTFAGTADIIAESYSRGVQLYGLHIAVRTMLTPDAVHNMRSHILDLIMERAKKASKQQAGLLWQVDAKH